MFTKITTALAVILALGSPALALAQGFDPNLSNRYPHLADPHMHGYVDGANAPVQMGQAPTAPSQSAPVHLRQHHGVNAPRQAHQPGAQHRSQ
jgi:hypothetical protein